MMIGQNTLRLNKATMKVVVQHYLDTVLLNHRSTVERPNEVGVIEVADVSWVSRSGGDAFEVRLESTKKDGPGE